MLIAPNIPQGVVACDVPIFNTNRLYRVNRKFASEKDLINFVDTITESAQEVRYFVKALKPDCWVLTRMSAIGKRRVCYMDSKKNVSGGCRDLGIRGAFFHEYIGQGNDCNIPLDQINAEKSIYKFEKELPYQVVRFRKTMTKYDTFTETIKQIKTIQETYPENNYYVKLNSFTKLWEVVSRQPIGFMNDDYNTCNKDVEGFQKDDSENIYLIEYKGHRFK